VSRLAVGDHRKRKSPNYDWGHERDESRQHHQHPAAYPSPCGGGQTQPDAVSRQQASNENG
jgi:hypothetical protein